MVVLNEMSRFHLAIDALKQVPRLRSQASEVIDMFNASSTNITTIFANISKICRRSGTGNGRLISVIQAPSSTPLAKGHPARKHVYR